MAEVESINGNPIVAEVASESIQPSVDAWLAAHPEATTTVQDNSITNAKLVQSGGILSDVGDMHLDAGDGLSITMPPVAGANFRTLQGFTLRKGCAYEFTSTQTSDGANTSWALFDGSGTQLVNLGGSVAGQMKWYGYTPSADIEGAYFQHWGNSASGTFTDTVRLVIDKDKAAEGGAYAAMASLTGFDMSMDASDFFCGSFNQNGYAGSETLRICTAPMLVKGGAVVSWSAGASGLYCDVVYLAKDAENKVIYSTNLIADNWRQNATVTIPNDGYLVVLAATAATYGASSAIKPSDFDSTVTIRRPYSAGAVTAQNVLEQSFNAAYHEGASDFATKCTQFSALMYGDTMADATAPSDMESFLFFTDPHLCESSGWEDRCYEYIAQIQKYYNSTPTTFCMCGGDWLGNGDLPAEACFKMGYIDGFMHSMFDNCYMLVGNHDTNYQGKLTESSANWTTRLSDQSIRDLWYRGGKAYYEFSGANTRFFCFDTGIEAQTLTENGNYGYEQAYWFAEQLISNTADHIAIAAHILYYNEQLVLQPLSKLVLDTAQAFNSRGTISFVGSTYNFANTTGKVEFAIFGHIHADSDVVINGIPCIVTTWVRDNDSLGPTFDLMLADYSNRVLHAVRVGAGSSRTINLAQ